VVDGQQIDISMARGAQYHLVDTQTGQIPDGMRVVENNGQIEIFGGDSYPWITMHQADATTTNTAATATHINDTFQPAPPETEDNASILAAPTPEGQAEAVAQHVEHVQADEVLDSSATPAHSVEAFEAPSSTSLLIASGGALLVGGLAAVAGGGGRDSHDDGFSIKPSAIHSPQAHEDAYSLHMNGESLDLAKAVQSDILDVNNGKMDTLHLTVNDVLNKSTGLSIEGEQGDAIQLAGGHWTQLADEGHYHIYQHNHFVARIDEEISVALI
ncbi:MAG: hypothetical protein Q4A74_01745, partial [Cardiobacteriaceae bacterium]|nr:hypothetical protein [Cardiobacteriaceae bacterium]